ncbi:MAG: ABC transporter permease [Mesorhizobium sp.]|uniref:ABC transporter permease n=1 Tax=Mesorhizobium sp. TaxID=1871066 RepID=UPI0012133C9D|nr:ABC transporter permease [Mesorhizobium sp.]TIN95525.1 MAG: ABC transporter permease [Mesorhizobium sp.]TJU97172.1 MAG: ABC transporter permease [Mesorhizobium sp.]
MTGRLTRAVLFLAVAALPVCLVVVPIVSILVMSVRRLVDNRISGDFSLVNYATFLTDPVYLQVLLVTLAICLGVTVTGIVLGYPIAYFIWRRRRAKYVFLLLFVLPLFMSYIVKIYTMRSILGLNGFLNQILVATGILEKPSLLFLYNKLSILLTMAVIFLPFAILPIFLSLEKIPGNLAQASADLGASPGATFRHVIFPLSAPGTVAGGLFVFVLALGDFITPQMVGGPSGFTFGRIIWSQFGLAYNWPLGAALAGVLLALSLVVIVAAGMIARQQRI